MGLSDLGEMDIRGIVQTGELVDFDVKNPQELVCVLGLGLVLGSVCAPGIQIMAACR